MHKLLITIAEGGVEQSGPVKCTTKELGELMRKMVELIETGAEVRISAYDEEAAEADFVDGLGGGGYPKEPAEFDHGYMTVDQFPRF